MIGGALVRGSSGSIDPATAALRRAVLPSPSLCLSDNDRYRACCCFDTVVHARPGHVTRCGRVSVAGYWCVVVVLCGGVCWVLSVVIRGWCSSARALLGGSGLPRRCALCRRCLASRPSNLGGLRLV